MRRRLCERKFHRSNHGTTLIEIIIVFAMIAILAGGSVLLLGQLRFASTKRAVAEIDKAIDKLEVTALTKAKSPYLYIYKLGNSYYMKTTDVKVDASNQATILDNSGQRFAGGNITIRMDDASTGTIVDGNQYIVIAYTKAMTFDRSITNVHNVIVYGSSVKKITLKDDTGKHFIE